MKQIAIAFVVILLLLWFSLKFIGCYTKHGDEIMVPNLLGVNINKIEEADPHKNFEFRVIDSVYDEGYEKGAIVLQDPPARSMVKRGRKIYLTIMSSQPEIVTMPNLVDLSLRQALSELKSAGLKVGVLEYVDNFAKNAVLEQKFDGEVISPGTRLQKDSPIQIVMGKGVNTEKVAVPFLIGKTENEAFDILNCASLNIGNVSYLDEKNKVHSRVYLQSPAANSDTLLVFGSFVDLWFRSDLDFNFNELIESIKADTLISDSLRVDSLIF